MGEGRVMRHGITIVEIMVALAVLGIAIGAAFSAMGSSWAADRVTEERDRAVGGLVRQLEIIQQLRVADAFDQLSVDGGYTFEVLGLDNGSGGPVGSIALPDGATRTVTVLRLTCTVSWLSVSGPQTVTIPYSHIDR